MGERTLTKSYENMRGVSFDADQSGSKNGRYSYLENMYVDYDSDQPTVESIPGFRLLRSFGSKIYGVFLQNVGSDKEYIIVHAGTKLYRFEKSRRDSLQSITVLGKISANKSSSFSFGTDLYVLDGENIYRITASGSFYTLGTTGCMPYIPTTFKNGEPYEDRNLLTNEFCEVYKIGNALDDLYETPGLVYEITDESNSTCTVSGITNSSETVIDIPTYKVLGNKRYRIIGIADYAFAANTKIKELHTNHGLEFIGEEAFMGCTALSCVTLSDTVKKIGRRSFHGATALESFAIGKGLESVGSGAFGAASKLTFSYPYTSVEIAKIENSSVLTSYTIKYGVTYNAVTVALKIHSPMETYTYIKVDGATQTSYGDTYTFKYKPEYNAASGAIRMVCSNRGCIEEKIVEIGGSLKNESTRIDGECADFFSSVFGASIDPKEAIVGCTKVASYDGRIFLSANPDLGGSVFYSATDAHGSVMPLYFGSRDFFIDGLGDYKVNSLLTTSEALAVFKSGDDGSGSIFYHTPKVASGINKKSYPLSYVHAGVKAMGGSFNFFDEAMFLCDMGLCSLERGSGTYRSVKCRSGAINQRLLCESLENISITEWCGYLVLCSGGKIFLADSRDSYSTGGSKQYEWYYLTGIGTYKNDRTVYRYSSVAPTGFFTYREPDARVSDEDVVMSVYVNGETVYYVEQDNKKYAVYPTSERSGGNFSSAETVIGCGNLLFFFTKGGDMCVFNNDKRGEVPSEISSATGFSEEDYPQEMKSKIHPYFYSFNNHSPRYALQTVMDECSAPHLTKKSVRSSLVIKCKSPIRSHIVCRVGTDRGVYTERTSVPASKLSFDTLDFSSISFVTDDKCIIPISEGERGWISKQITLVGEEYCSPIGVYSISYQYKIKGKIRKNQEVI